MLFYSFQATSSSFRLIRRPVGSGIFRQEYEYDICVEDYTLILADPAIGGVGLGHRGCPTTPDDRPAAVVNTEHPFFVTLGFLLILLGFTIQFFAVPEPRSIAQLRQEIKLLKLQQKSAKSQNP
ncbi:MAG TPA: hypothetical protein VME18_12105 [Acidobacteriaceae bacterium]|nr:hypothetical protein [Acidobacteriaceae bacterium]